MNKVKTTLNTIKSVTRKKSMPDKIHTLNTDSNVTSHQQLISDFFNEYFSSIAD
jgi:copper chaperone CopZ